MNLALSPTTDRSQLPPGTRLLKRGERLLEPDVWLTSKNGWNVVLKDYRRYAGKPMALPARLLVRHEAKILRRLHGWEYAPALIDFGVPLLLGMQFIPGETLGDANAAANDAVFEQLQQALRELHAAGITHNDLHGANVVVHDGMPVLIDFASASWLPRWLRGSLLGRQLRRADWKHLFKLRQRLTGRMPTAAQSRRVAEPRWVRKLREVWARIHDRYFVPAGAGAH